VVGLPQLSPDSATSAGGSEVLNASTGAGDPNSGDAQDQGVEQAPSDEAEVDSPTGPNFFAVTEDSLLTSMDIRSVGEAEANPVPYGSSLVLPPLCGAESSYRQYSEPAVVVSAVWVLFDGTLNQSGLQYESEERAANALARLVQDSQTCPVVNEFSSVHYVAIDASVGAEIAFFDVQQGTGQDGSFYIASVTVARIGNVLVEMALNPAVPGMAAGDNRSRALAAAAVNRIADLG